MAPNRLSRKRAMQLCADKESPLDIMFDMRTARVVWALRRCRSEMSCTRSRHESGGLAEWVRIRGLFEASAIAFRAPVKPVRIRLIPLTLTY
jgi:hypothetical protein